MPLPETQFVRSVARVVRGGALVAVCVLGISGCGTVNGSSSSITQLRIIDADSAAGGLDIYASGGAIAYNLGFGTVTSYVPMTPATYAIKADTAGSTTAVSTVSAGLATGKAYTLLISPSGATVQSQVLTDQSQPAPTGDISLRFLDESQSVGTVDLYLVPSGATLATTTVLQQGLVYGTNTGYLNVATGTYTLYIVQTGTVISTTTVPLYTGGSTAYPSGSARTVLILDNKLVTSPPVTVTTLSDYDSATATSSR